MFQNIILIFSLLFFVATATPIQNWTCDGKYKISLLGTIHIADSSFYPLSPQVDALIRKANIILPEADLDAEQNQAINQKIMKLSLLDSNLTLSTQMSPQLWSALKDWSLKNHFPLQNMHAFKPWAIIPVISLWTLKLHGMNGELGIDRAILTLAHQQKKKIVELEGIEAQINLFNNLDSSLVEILLQESLSESDSLLPLFAKMKESWFAGDVQKLYQDLNSNSDNNNDSLHQHFTQIMIAQRNKKMATKIWSLRKQSPLLVVVGAAHLTSGTKLTPPQDFKGIGDYLSEKKCVLNH